MICLSPRQQEVAELLDQGLDYKAIQVRLAMSYNRVAQHVKRIAFLVEPDRDIRVAQGPKLTVVLWLKHRRWLATHRADAAD
ncbi:MAG: hypothetical protein JWP02_3559 [Acidimicrobiales bacterium]|nr:hypothetical protein [Acidimicrobiales bacterium]